MIKESIMKDIDGLSANEIASAYSKRQLQDMYKTLFSIEARNSYTKLDLAYHCREFVESDKRTRDLCKILR